MNASIRKDFVDGIQEIFTELFTDGVNDGLNLYFLSEQTLADDVYGEQKYKVYKKPILLVCNAQLTPTLGEQAIEVYKDMVQFKVPLKSLEEHNISVTHEGLDKLRKCVIEFHNVFYVVENVSPVTFVEDTYLVYKFECKEDRKMTSVILETEETEDS